MNRPTFFFLIFLIPAFLYCQSDYQLFYTPPIGAAGDFIPFYDNGEFRLFYLQDWRDKDKFGEGTAWYQIGTKDFVHFKEYGEMIPRGATDSQDLYIYTGSVLKADGKYHIFYTGHNFNYPKLGKPQEAIMHAVSTDLIHWQKIPEDAFYAPTDKYEKDDWRDPFVFWNEEAHEYWMIIAARTKEIKTSGKSGCTLICSSKDLKKWQIKNYLWQPGLYPVHECPDLFKMGGWWYMIYSVSGTHYIMSKSLNGPWIRPDDDLFDALAFYAAKSYSDGSHRYLFGWNPTKSDDRDSRNWQWGGSLVVHEIYQNPDGTLSVKVPESIDNAFSTELESSLTPLIGDCNVQDKRVSINAENSYAAALSGDMPRCCKISTTVKFEKNTRQCGIILRSDNNLEHNYIIRLEPRKNRIVFSLSPVYMEMERPVDLNPDIPHEIKVFVDGTNCVIYVDNKTAISTRLYNIDNGKWGIFAEDGKADFTNSRIFRINK